MQQIPLRRLPLLLFGTLASLGMFGQTPYERWFSGIIYGSNGRVYVDSSAIVTGQFYPSYTYLVKTDAIGAPVATCRPSITGKITTLIGSVFTPPGDVLLANNKITQNFPYSAEGVVSRWTTDLDTNWAYAYRDTVFDHSHVLSPGILTSDDDGFAVSYQFGDSASPFGSAAAVLFLDSMGTVLWGRYAPAGFTLGHLIRANDGGFLGTGTANGEHLYFRTDAQLGLLWCRSLDAPFELRGERIAQGLDDMVHYFVGIRDTAEVINFGTMTYSRSMAWINIDPGTGSMVSNQEVDFRWPTQFTHLQRASDGHFLAAGRYTNNTRISGVLRRWEAFVFKLNSDGDMIWADSLSMPGHRNRVISMDEHHDRLLLHTERYDHINPFHQYFVLDTSATPICELQRTAFQSLGALAITETSYPLASFDTITSIVRSPVTWTFDTTPMISPYACMDLSTALPDPMERTFRVYPDPATDVVQLDLPAGLLTGTLSVHDAFGRIVFQGPLDRQLDVSGFSPGSYVITLNTGTKRTFARFIKQ